MKSLLVIVPCAALAAGCAVPIQTLAGAYPGGYVNPYAQRPMYPRPVGPQVNLAASLPIGRWDNVMMSAVGTPLLVLMMNGTTANGALVAATSASVRLHVAAGDVELQAADVMRVDRLSGGAGDVVKDGARGAAFGAGVVGVLGLIAGHVPPPRLFAAGGIIGAEQNIEVAKLARGSTTIYLAESAAPQVAAAVNAMRQSPASRVGARGPCVAANPACNSQIRYRR
jgi:hypothetical protein